MIYNMTDLNNKLVFVQKQGLCNELMLEMTGIAKVVGNRIYVKGIGGQLSIPAEMVHSTTVEENGKIWVYLK